MNYKVSIVTVTWNCNPVVESTIKNVLEQDYENIEYLIIDGKSTDGTLDIIEKYRDKIDVIISEEDKGIFDAMNKGIQYSTGDWILFLNAGDYFVNNHILSKIFTKSDYKSVDVIYGETAYIADNHFYTYRSVPFFNTKTKYSGMGVCHQSIFVRLLLAKQYKFDIAYKVAADYNMINQIYKANGTFYYYDGTISAIDTNGFSVRNKKKQRQEIMKICGVKPNIILDCEFMYWDLKLFFKSIIKKIFKKVFPKYMDKIRSMKKHTVKIN